MVDEAGVETERVLASLPFPSAANAAAAAATAAAVAVASAFVLAAVSPFADSALASAFEYPLFPLL